MAPRTSAAELTTNLSTNNAITSVSTQSAGPDNVLGTFSDMPQLSGLWRHPNDPDVLKSPLIDLLGTTDSPPAKRPKTGSGQTTAESRNISCLNSSALKHAFLLAYNGMTGGNATSDITGLPTAAAINRMEYALTCFGLIDPFASMIVDGVRILVQYRLLRDARYKTIEKLTKDLKRLTTEIEEVSKSYQSSDVWQFPRLTLKDSKVVVAEDEAIARKHEQAKKAVEDLKNTVATLNLEWTKISQLEGPHLRTNGASRKVDNDPVGPTPARITRTISPANSQFTEILESISSPNVHMLG